MGASETLTIQSNGSNGLGMNRRSFFAKLALGAATFTILPPATTYGRIWKARREVNPNWVKAEPAFTIWNEHGIIVYDSRMELSVAQAHLDELFNHRTFPIQDTWKWNKIPS